MARILITSGPTRQYLDPVRYLTNASSGRMGAALAAAALRLGHQVVIVSGPVAVDYPAGAEVVDVETTEQMLAVAGELFAGCQGAIGAAAPCDYRPRQVNVQKIAKTGGPLVVEFIETPDVVATLGQQKRADQWVVGFALETEDHHFRAIVKLERKHCDLMVSNGAEAINAAETQVALLAPDGEVLAELAGSKEAVADGLLREIDVRLCQPLK
ncbi:phosphopantothenoylcysteine decarboxylase [Candidatus Laterigemmans baculatus]|uniref:phosphopantothenoylcysteine decarboxylase n=1 Tax=Candidatus Laterigemmans baculatus TaxID=2770505 RepID=UPI001F25CFEE|nr:phosphopantothenoylcysteine decarboxylase [Candidatus Laterigemmans baculatus]